MTKLRQSSVPTLKLLPLPSPFSCQVAHKPPGQCATQQEKGMGKGWGGGLALTKSKAPNQVLKIFQKCTEFNIGQLCQRVLFALCLQQCYSPTNSCNVKNVFTKSINVLKILNNLGYVSKSNRLRLDLVYNPLGATLPPSQEALEQKFKEESYQYAELADSSKP